MRAFSPPMRTSVRERDECQSTWNFFERGSILMPMEASNLSHFVRLWFTCVWLLCEFFFPRCSTSLSLSRVYDSCIIINTLRAVDDDDSRAFRSRAMSDDTCPTDCICNRDIGVLSFKVEDHIYATDFYLFIFLLWDHVTIYDFVDEIYYRVVLQLWRCERDLNNVNFVSELFFNPLESSVSLQKDC